MASWSKYLRSNLNTARKVAKGIPAAEWKAAMRSSALTGAVAGGIWGAADSITGQDRTSIFGGALQGAMLGGLFGAGKTLRAGSLSRRARIMSRARNWEAGFGRR